MQWLISTIVIAFTVTSIANAGSLFDAASQGDLEVVKKLLDDRVEVDERGRYGETPLMAAALAGEIATAEMLIVHGAEVMARNEGGLTPLHAAAYSGSNEVAQLLLDHGAKLEDSANVSGATPLIVASQENHVVIAELLISRGADLSVPDRDGFTALTVAWMKQRIEMVRLLKRHGAICQPVEVLGTEDYYNQCAEAGT